MHNFSNNRYRKKVFVLGVDGATFDIINPLVAKGELPNFKKMLDEGSWGELESTVPPFSGAAWTSFQTGKNPGNHGIFDFINKKPNSYQTYYINSSYVKGARLWDILGSNGLKVGVINVMVTYPPHPVNGFLLTGGLTPPGKGFAYPESLEEEITQRFGDYRIWNVGGINLTRGGEKKFIDSYFTNEKRRMDIARHMMQTREWDFFMVMLESADPLQHELWKYIDETHPWFNPDVEDFIKQAIPNLYKEFDSFLGEMFATLPEDTTFCIMSDHGFGPLNRYLLVNNLLMDIGMLKFNSNLSFVLKQFFFNHGISIEKIYRLSRRVGLDRIAKAFRGGAKGKILNHITPSLLDVNWSKTRAFSVGTGGHIYLNVKNREPEGIVEPGSDYEKVRDGIIECLISLTDPQNGKKVIEKVFTRDELYSGKLFTHAPDLSFLPSRGYGTLQREQLISPHKYIDSPSSGTHRINGVFMMRGPDIRSSTTIEDAQIFDIAPTILHLFGLPVPDDMDGKVLTSVFRDGSDPAQRDITYQASEEQRIKRKLKQLKARKRL